MQGPQVLYFLFKFLVTPYHFKTSRPFQNLPCNKLLVSPCFFRMSADGINQILHICSSNEKRKSVQRFCMCRTFFSCPVDTLSILFTLHALLAHAPSLRLLLLRCYYPLLLPCSPNYIHTDSYYCIHTPHAILLATHFVPSGCTDQNIQNFFIPSPFPLKDFSLHYPLTPPSLD